MGLKREVMCQVAGCPKPGPRTAAGAEWHAANMHKGTVATPKASKSKAAPVSLAEIPSVHALAQAMGAVLGPILEHQTQVLLAALKPVRKPAPTSKPPLVATVPQGPPASNPALASK